MIGRRKYKLLVGKQMQGDVLTELELADIVAYEESTWNLSSDFKKKQKEAWQKIVQQKKQKEALKNKTYSENELKEKFINLGLTFINKNKKEDIEPFVIDQKNNIQIGYLWDYFTLKNKKSQHKGIALYGSVGSGKSVLMELHRQMKWHNNRYNKVSSLELVRYFSKKGYEGIEPFFKGNLFIDEVGLEDPAIYFGNKINVLEIVFLERYNEFQNNGAKTHITTNLNKEMLEKKYGERFKSRMFEMFNFINLGRNERDFRKELET